MPTPEITSIEPLTGKPEGGEEVVVQGHHLDEVTQVAVGNALVDVTGVSDSELKYISPAAPSDARGTDLHMGLVFHTREGGDISGGWMVFVYEGHVPLVESVEPSFVHPAGGDAVQVSGEHLDMITHVGVGVAGTVEATPMHGGLTFVAPPLPEEESSRGEMSMGMVFFLADGSSVSWPNGLVYAYPYGDHQGLTEHTMDAGELELAPGHRPSVDLVQPDHGPVSGGDWVSITGGNLDHAVSVTFRGIPAHFDTGPDSSLYAYPPPYDHAQMGAYEVSVEVHSDVHGVSIERVTYRYDGLDATARETPRGWANWVPVPGSPPRARTSAAGPPIKCKNADLSNAVRRSSPIARRQRQPRTAAVTQS